MPLVLSKNVTLLGLRSDEMAAYVCVCLCVCVCGWVGGGGLDQMWALNTLVSERLYHISGGLKILLNPNGFMLSKQLW